MKAQLLTLATVLSTLVACNNSATTTIVNKDSTIVVTTDSSNNTITTTINNSDSTLKKIVVKNEVLVAEKVEVSEFYEASGSEPGWFINIKQTSLDTYPTEVQLNYGKEKWAGELTRKMEAASNKINLAGTLSFNGKMQNFTVVINKEKCTHDASGEVRNATVSVKTDKQNLKACGNLVK